jgi:hypothetical protein
VTSRAGSLAGANGASATNSAPSKTGIERTRTALGKRGGRAKTCRTSREVPEALPLLGLTGKVRLSIRPREPAVRARQLIGAASTDAGGLLQSLAFRATSNRLSALPLWTRRSSGCAGNDEMTGSAWRSEAR